MIGQYTIIDLSESNQTVRGFLSFTMKSDNARLQQKDNVNFFVLCKLTLTKLVSVFILVRLCNTIMFGMGPTDDPFDGISLDEVVSDENPLAISNKSVDEQ